MKEMKRILSLVMAALMIMSIISFAGCAKTTGGETASTTATQKSGDTTTATAAATTEDKPAYKFDKNTKATIRLYTINTYTTPHESLGSDYDMYEDFKKMYPNITIELVDITPEMTAPDKKIIADTAAGTPPDVFYARNFHVKPFVEQDIVYCLDEYIEKDPAGVAHLMEGALKLTTYQGKVWMIPTNLFSYNMYYNKPLFDKYGVPYPTDDWTLEDFREIARKLTKHDGDSISIGFAIDYLPLWITGAAGAKPMVREGDRWKIQVETDPGSIKAVETFIEMMQKDKIIFTDDEWQATGGQKNGIHNPAIGMMFMGSFGYNEEKQWDCVLPPQGPNGERSTFCQSFVFGIHTNAANKDACWELIKYIISDDFLKKSAEWIGNDKPYLPAGIPLNKIYIERTDLKPERLATMKKHMEAFKFWTPIDEFPMNDLGWYFFNAAKAVYDGQKDLATAMKDMAIDLDKNFNPQPAQ